MKISSKYQVVIPNNIREALGLKPGTEVDVIAKGGIAYIVPVKKLSDLVKATKHRLNEQDSQSVREKKDRKV